MSSTCTSQELLERTGIDTTPHRETILSAVTTAGKALTVKNIQSMLNNGRGMDKVTLYRTLDLFVSKGLLKKIPLPNGSMAYELVCAKHRPSHPHFICRICGDIRCLEGEGMTELQNQLKQDFEQKELDLKMEGLCSTCQEG